MSRRSSLPLDRLDRGEGTGHPGGLPLRLATLSAPWATGRALVALLAVGVALAVLIGLGTWQLQRRAWKEDLLAQVEARAHAEPAPVPAPREWPQLTRERDEYRHVRARGVFDHAREALVYTVRGSDEPEPRGAGYLVITPLMRADGPPLLINRGFVPLALRDPHARADGQIAGEAEVVGLLRMPEAASWFVPANDEAGNAFYRRDPGSIAAARGLIDAAPFIIDQDAPVAPGGWPRGGATRLVFPNRHLEYALTWYGLATTLVAVSLAVAWSRRRGRR
ncbi:MULTISPECIES: SURF1 family protein [unclassified Xanthobacter]|uniref:SURF1 family protein n=1 Tax=unclassified Xanthobacter TaxID=2623496 RepID=UPI001EDF3A29|nr:MULTISPECIES: SURF1 family protein [unclassified Xanthobacter]